MMTLKSAVLLIVGFCLALAAGTTSGVLAERMRSPGAMPGASDLAGQLQLTTDQSGQMRQIWEGVRNTVDDCYQQAQGLQNQRDQALIGLLTDEQKAKFAQQDKEFARQYADLKAKRQVAFDQAVAETEKILTPSQRSQYERILRERVGPRITTLPTGEMSQP